MNAITEEFVLTEGRSLIDLRCGPVGGALLINGVPVALHWCDEQGSVAEYLLRASATDFEERLTALREVVASGFLENQNISQQIGDFLQLFVPGNYRLSYYKQAGANLYYYDFDSTWNFKDDYNGFYPFDFSFLFTQPTDSFDEQRVEYYVELIRGGKRPLALTASLGYEVYYVLDGHHKLAAYSKLKQRPAFIDVARIDAPELDFNPLITHFDVSEDVTRHYSSRIN